MDDNSSVRSMTVRPATIDRPFSVHNSVAPSQDHEVQTPQPVQEQSHSHLPEYNSFNGHQYYQDAYQRYGEWLKEADSPVEAMYERNFDMPNILRTEGTESPYESAQYDMPQTYTWPDRHQSGNYPYNYRRSNFTPPSLYVPLSPHTRRSYAPLPSPHPHHSSLLSQDSRTQQQYPVEDDDNWGQQFHDIMSNIGPSFPRGMDEYDNHNGYHSRHIQPTTFRYAPVEAIDTEEYEVDDRDEEVDYGGNEYDDEDMESFDEGIQHHPSQSKYCTTTVGDELRAKGPFTAQGLEEYQRREKQKANELSSLAAGNKKRKQDATATRPYTQASLAMDASTGRSSARGLEQAARNGHFSLIPNVGHSKLSNMNFERAIQAPLETVNNNEVTDAALKKRNIERAPGEKSLKKGKGASDPENIEIVNMKDSGKDFVQISQYINAQRVNRGKKADLTPGAVNCRYNRTAPVLYAAYGRPFVPICKRNANGRRTRRQFAHNDGNIVFGKGLDWNPQLDEILTDCVKEYDKKKWEEVAKMFQQATGKEVDTRTIAWRYGII